MWVPPLGLEDPLEEYVNPLQYSCQRNAMDRGAWGHKESDMTDAT